MSIADKLTTVAENMQKVGEILSDCNAVLPTKGASTAETLEQVPQRIGEIEYLPNPLLYAVKTGNLYQNVVFPNGYEIVIVVPNHQGNMQNMFYGTKGLRKITMDVPTETAFDLYGFVREGTVEEVVLTDGIHITSWNYFAFFANNLRKVIGRINLSGNTSNGAAVNNTKNLEEIYFMPNTIEASINIGSASKLIDASIQSIIDGLAEVATAQTVTFHADVKAKLTDAQKAQITAKNWTLG